MQRLTSLAGKLALLLSIAGCAAEIDPQGLEAGGEVALLSGSCAFIPGCTQIIEVSEATDGPVAATVTTYVDEEGNEGHRLSVTYWESDNRDFLLCSRFPQQPTLSLVFVVGPEDDRRSVTVPMRASCPRSYGDNGGVLNYASFALDRADDPELWDTLFPPAADGSRWYAMQVALSNHYGAWDSRYGYNYRLVLEPR